MSATLTSSITHRNIFLSVLGVIILLVIAFNVPLGTTNYDPMGSNGITLPAGFKQGEVCCMYSVSFTSPRGIIGSKIDMDNALKNYHKIKWLKGGDNANVDWYTNDDYSIIFRYWMTGSLLGSRIQVEYGYSAGDIGNYFEDY